MDSTETHGSQPNPERPTTPINIRIRHRQRDLIDRAARMAGKTRSEFMIDAASREAENVLLDRRLFLLDAAAHTRFLKLLDEPPKANHKLRALLDMKPVWEK